MSVRNSGARAASAGGQLLRAATRLVTTRPAAKPLHPRGAVVSGTLSRSGAESPTGATWLDQPGVDSVIVRQSRAIGLPSSLPDIFGLAVRVSISSHDHGDLLFATTGLGRFTRYTLTATRTPFGRPMTTLLPYRASAGPVLLAAMFRDEVTLALAWAIRSGPWHSFAELSLRDALADGADSPLSFDPISNTLPGLDNYEWVRRLREPSYSDARRSRRS